MLSSTVISCGSPSGGTTQPVDGKSSNRLVAESSPYLLEHAHDPVDWYPWGDEAFKRAKRENKPVLLSVGYSACHWCHVMQRESFQNSEIAKYLNDNFVCVKVDREERPDIDEVYMRAVQAINGSGGWPMTVFLTADRKPFFAGTYFPPKDAQGMPGFGRVLAAVKDSWSRNQSGISSSSQEIISSISHLDLPAKSLQSPSRETLNTALRQILHRVDPVWGGLGQAPKFPMPGVLQFCLRETAGKDGETKGGGESLAFVVRTLEKMSQGGIHDQVEGGFCRYSTDREWQIPHFEKMLYDNALLADVYLDAYARTGNVEFADTAKDTLDFMDRELSSPEGGFYSSLDADSGGEEGAYYVFSLAEIERSLEKADARFVQDTFGVTNSGNFGSRLNVLFRSDCTDALARQRGESQQTFRAKLQSVKEKLRELRSRRSKPRRDEKIIASWNALAISSFVHGYRIFGDERYLRRARECAQFVLTKMYTEKRLHRIWARGKAKQFGCLDDYSFCVQSLLDLAMLDSSGRWLHSAEEMNETILREFLDSEHGAFFYTAKIQNQPLMRTRAVADNILPSGTAVEVINLMKLSELNDSESFKRTAGEAVSSCEMLLRENPLVHAYMLCALDLYLGPRTQVVLVGSKPTEVLTQMRAAINRPYMPNQAAIVRIGGIGPGDFEVLKGKKCIADKPTVYICQGHSCEAPITSLKGLADKLDYLSNAQR